MSSNPNNYRITSDELRVVGFVLDIKSKKNNQYAWSKDNKVYWNYPVLEVIENNENRVLIRIHKFKGPNGLFGAREVVFEGLIKSFGLLNAIVDSLDLNNYKKIK